MYNPHNKKLATKLSLFALLNVSLFLVPSDTKCAPIIEHYSKSEVISLEQPLVQSALHCIYPDEEFNFASKPNLTPHAIVTINNETTCGYWSIEANLDYRAVFINLDKSGNDSIDIYDWQANKKEDLIANSSALKDCISIWLVTASGEYNIVWFNHEQDPNIVREKDGFSIHLNPRQST